MQNMLPVEGTEFFRFIPAVGADDFLNPVEQGPVEI